MSVAIGLDQSRKNTINFLWDAWPTNSFALWFPETWAFTNDKDRLRVTDALEWKLGAGSARVEGVKDACRDYSFVWSSRLTPEGNAAKIELNITNNGTVGLPSFFHVNACLNFINAPDFMDSTGAYTFFRTSTGWQSMDAWRRRQALRQGHDPYHILLEGTEDPEDTELLGDVRTVSSLCVRHARDNSHSIGFAWDSPLRIDVNFNRLHCIHSIPRIGPLRPGETKAIGGRIYFHDGARDDLHAMCERDGMA